MIQLFSGLRGGVTSSSVGDYWQHGGLTHLEGLLLSSLREGVLFSGLDPRRYLERDCSLAQGPMGLDPR